MALLLALLFPEALAALPLAALLVLPLLLVLNNANLLVGPALEFRSRPEGLFVGPLSLLVPIDSLGFNLSGNIVV